MAIYSGFTNWKLRFFHSYVNVYQAGYICSGLMVDSWFNPLINTVHLPFSEPLFVGQKTTKNQDFGGAPTRRCSQEPTSQTSMGISMGTGRSKRVFFSRFETTKKTYTLVSHEYSLRVISYIVFFLMCVRKMESILPYTPGYYFIGKMHFGVPFFSNKSPVWSCE